MRIFSLLIALCLIGSGCQSARQRHAERQIVSADRETILAEQLTTNLDKAYGVWSDGRIAQILNEIMTRMLGADSSVAKSATGVHVHLLATTTQYVAAGLAKTVYISKGMLQSLRFENELAYLLAMQIALVKERVPARTLAHLQGQELGESILALPTASIGMQRDFIEKEWFEPGGLFDFGGEAYLSAEREGIRLAYAAKYDPRGAVTLIQRWQNGGVEERQYRALGKILPEPEDQLRVAREEVAKLSPLRDPIVRSIAFEELQAQLHSKKAKRKKN